MHSRLRNTSKKRRGGGGNSYHDYDADSKRVSQRTADGFRQFVYQGPDMLKLQMERDESEETVAHYTIGAGLEAMRRETSSFYHYNHLGTTLALTGANEAVTDTYRHDAWGVLLASTGSTVNPHAYVGRERYYRMPEAAMYHLGFRDYAQGVGRFMTVDPINEIVMVGILQDSINSELLRSISQMRPPKPYGYSRNACPRRVDPWGLRSLTPDEWRMLEEAMALLGIDPHDPMFTWIVENLHFGNIAFVDRLTGSQNLAIRLDPAFFGKEPPPQPVHGKGIRASVLLHEIAHKIGGLGEEDAYILTNCFIQAHYGGLTVKKWYFSEKYKPADWETNWCNYCKDAKYSDWKQYLPKQEGG